jgi:SAM-dependent methyltransferase
MRPWLVLACWAAWIGACAAVLHKVLPSRLHIGGKEAREGWVNINTMPGPHVDIVTSAADLSMFQTGQFDLVYASHVLEHLPYRRELPAALFEIFRVLGPRGQLWMSVPDLRRIARAFLDPALSLERERVLLQVVYGGQLDEFDFHYWGFTFPTANWTFHQVGFSHVEEVGPFTVFNDTSTNMYSLNLIAYKGRAT